MKAFIYEKNATKVKDKAWGYAQCSDILECGAELGGSLDEAIRRWNERAKK